MLREHFLAEINRYLEAHDMSGNEFGWLALRDRGFVSRLRNGKDVRLETMMRVRNFMSKSKRRMAAE